MEFDFDNNLYALHFGPERVLYTSLFDFCYYIIKLHKGNCTEK
jgi:hypothetical protein